MKNKIILAVGLTVSLILTSTILAFSQEQTPLKAPVLDSQAESDTQWLWGEVVSVDIPKNELLVKYLDYDTEQEKEMVISINNNTVYENVRTASEIKSHDAVSIDYVLAAGGMTLAKKISIEKPEELDTPQNATPDDLAVTPDTAGK